MVKGPCAPGESWAPMCPQPRVPNGSGGRSGGHRGRVPRGADGAIRARRRRPRAEPPTEMVSSCLLHRSALRTCLPRANRRLHSRGPRHCPGATGRGAVPGQSAGRTHGRRDLAARGGCRGRRRRHTRRPDRDGEPAPAAQAVVRHVVGRVRAPTEAADQARCAVDVAPRHPRDLCRHPTPATSERLRDAAPLDRGAPGRIWDQERTRRHRRCPRATRCEAGLIRRPVRMNKGAGQRPNRKESAR